MFVHVVAVNLFVLSKQQTVSLAVRLADDLPVEWKKNVSRPTRPRRSIDTLSELLIMCTTTKSA